MDYREIVLGADPEIFVEANDGKNIPAFEFLNSKTRPQRTKEEGMGYYWDGFQAEFNILPSDDLSKCLTSIRYGLKAIYNAAKYNFSDIPRLSTNTVIEVSQKYLEELPSEFTEFGCMPSYNIYEISGIKGEGNTVPYRFAGGHIHFGIGQQPQEKISAIVNALDSILGVACVSLFEHIDNPVRRMYYGLAGEYRTPPHGLEYRVLSNGWLFHPSAAAAVLELSRKVVASVFNNTYKWETTVGETIEVILTNNAEKAREILNRNIDVLRALDCERDFLQPIEKSITGIHNVENNWSI